MALILKRLLETTTTGPAGAVPDAVPAARLRPHRPGPGLGAPVAGRGAAWLGWSCAAPGCGYHVYAVGGDERGVARSPGLRTHRAVDRRPRALLAWPPALPACSWPAGSARARRASGTDGGYDLESIAAVVLGGTALAGGRGRVSGHGRRRARARRAGQRLQPARLDPFLKRRRARRRHHRRRRALRPARSCGPPGARHRWRRRHDRRGPGPSAPAPRAPTWCRGARAEPRLGAWRAARRLRRAGRAAGVDLRSRTPTSPSRRLPRLPEAGRAAGRSSPPASTS